LKPKTPDLNQKTAFPKKKSYRARSVGQAEYVSLDRKAAAPCGVAGPTERRTISLAAADGVAAPAPPPLNDLHDVRSTQDALPPRPIQHAHLRAAVVRGWLPDPRHVQGR